MQLLKTRLLKLAAFIIGFQVLNMSIDPSNARPDDPDNATGDFNYIDSYVEYVAEVVLRFENAIPESGKSHQKQWQPHKLCKMTCDKSRVTYTPLIFYVALKKIFISHQDMYAYQFTKEICPPPELFR